MPMHLALLLAVAFIQFPLDGIAGERQVADVKELAGSWRGWVTGQQGEEPARMIVTENGSYRTTTTPGSTTEGKFYLQDGKLRYRSLGTTGTARVDEDGGITVLTVMPETPNSRTGSARYQRGK